MKRIYLDNAATTPLRKEVIDEMMNVLQTEYGNPSSSHSFGRSAKGIIELSRKTIAKNLHCTSQEIIFTSNATEATNLILRSAVKNSGVKRIITSKIEHHATLYTVKALQEEYSIRVDYVNILSDGSLDYSQLESLLSEDIITLVSLMHVNNETGVVNAIEKIGFLCKNNKALFHCDTVQSIGKTEINLQELPIDFIVASAHKFHGPKGVGFAFIRKNIPLKPIIFGGEQEKGLRAGTEAVHQIAGMSLALDLAYKHLDSERDYIIRLKEYCIERLHESLPNFKENGSETFYNILNILLPFSAEKAALVLFNLDMKGVAVSRGSACQSGSSKPSHVLAEMLSEEDLNKPSLRISFSHYNTKQDIDFLIESLREI